MNCQRGGGRSGMLASSEPGTGGANSNGGTGGPGAGEITHEPFPCAPGSARFTARVKSRGEPATTVMKSADCVGGVYLCPAPLIVVASCPAGAWPDPPSKGCGPWVSDY